MDKMLSQEEIEALLNEANLEDTGSNEEVKDKDSKNPTDGESDKDSEKESKQTTSTNNLRLSDEESDTIGEISNISMGSASTALSTLLNTRVNITTPQVIDTTWPELASEYEKPCVLIQIHYKEGLDGSSILIIKEEDVRYITDVMMGGDGSNISLEEELTELHLSAISEAMNQMMGSAATSLSTLLNAMVDISPPTSLVIDLNDNLEEVGNVNLSPFLMGEFISVSFNMTIGDQVDTNLLQLYPYEFAHNVYKKFMAVYNTSQEEVVEEVVEEEPPQEKVQEEVQAPSQQVVEEPQQRSIANEEIFESDSSSNVKVQAAAFQSLTKDNSINGHSQSIDLIQDVPLKVRVELGRANKSIKEILDFSSGTIVELDKTSGEPVDILVNDKLVAKGEVVVIDESFGVRITDIIK